MYSLSLVNYCYSITIFNRFINNKPTLFPNPEYSAKQRDQQTGSADDNDLHSNIQPFLDYGQRSYQQRQKIHTAPNPTETRAQTPTRAQVGKNSVVSTPSPKAGRATRYASHISRLCLKFILLHPFREASLSDVSRFIICAVKKLCYTHTALTSKEFTFST